MVLTTAQELGSGVEAVSASATSFSAAAPRRTAAARTSTAAADLAEVWPDSVLASSHQFGWRTLRAVQIRCGPEEADLPAFEHHAVVMHLGAEVEAEASVGDARYKGPIRRGAISIIPAGTPSLWR